jgi:hypothetical protein
LPLAIPARHSEELAISHEPKNARRRFFRVIVALVCFGISFGYLEAAVVAYLRASYEPLHQRFYPKRPATDLFPILRLDQLDAAGAEYRERLYIELGREAATLVMLAAVALAVARSLREWWAAFMLAFGVWDIFFYLFLQVQIGWPSSLFEWDLLFLLPVPWTGPVLAPLSVAFLMVIAGMVTYWRESTERPMRLAACHWLAILSSGLLIVLSLCWDFRNILSGGVPNIFNWPLLVTGGLLGVIAWLHALILPGHSTPQGAECLPSITRLQNEQLELADKSS